MRPKGIIILTPDAQPSLVVAGSLARSYFRLFSRDFVRDTGFSGLVYFYSTIDDVWL